MATSTATRLERGRAALAKLRHIAEREITADTPPRVRGGAITRARTQYNACYSAVSIVARGRKMRGQEPPTPAQMREAEQMIDEGWRLVQRARRFSK